MDCANWSACPPRAVAPDYHLARAQMLDAAGKAEDAIAAMNRAIEASPKDPDLYWQASLLAVPQ